VVVVGWLVGLNFNLSLALSFRFLVEKFEKQSKIFSKVLAKRGEMGLKLFQNTGQ
jgi:hypothetical protein